MKAHLTRLLAIVVSVASLALTCAIGTAGMASAQPITNSKTVNVVGTNLDTGQQVFTGTFTALSAKQDSSAKTGVSLVGDLNGQLTGQPGNPQGQGRGPQQVTRQNVAMPVNAISSAAAPAGESQGPACGILDLTLGPLDLNLLGLRVQLNQVHLVITAIPGGGLLGDLLCAVANLLNPAGAITDLVQFLNLLNQILGLLG